MSSKEIPGWHGKTKPLLCNKVENAKEERAPIINLLF